MRDVIERLKQMGAEPSCIAMLGGGSRSILWAGIRAGIMQLPVAIPSAAHSSVMGGALLAGMAVGAFPSLKSAMDELKCVAAIVEPKDTAALEDAYCRYRTLYSALKPVFQS
jgi:xylulokinase